MPKIFKFNFAFSRNIARKSFFLLLISHLQLQLLTAPKTEKKLLICYVNAVEGQLSNYRKLYSS